MVVRLEMSLGATPSDYAQQGPQRTMTRYLLERRRNDILRSRGFTASLMLAKAIVLIIFLGILFSLGSALVYMIKDKGQSDRTVKALTLRVGFSIGLFVLLFVLYALGVIQPHGVRP